MTQLQVLAHSLASEVEITIFHSQVIATISVVLNGKRRSLRLIKHIQHLHNNLNITCRNIAVLALTLTHLTCNLNDILTTQFGSTLTQFGIAILAENKLSDTVTVAQINKHHTTHLAHTLHPSAERNNLVNIGDSKLATTICTIHIINIYFIIFFICAKI